MDCKVKRTSSRRKNLTEDHNKDLIQYRRKTELFIEKQTASLSVKKEIGAYSFKSTLNNEHHLAFVSWWWCDRDEPLVRVHSECFTRIFLAQKDVIVYQLNRSLYTYWRKGKGLLFIWGKGTEIGEKTRQSLRTADRGYDTISANHQLGFEEDLRSVSLRSDKVFGVRE